MIDFFGDCFVKKSLLISISKIEFRCYNEFFWNRTWNDFFLIYLSGKLGEPPYPSPHPPPPHPIYIEHWTGAWQAICRWREKSIECVSMGVYSWGLLSPSPRIYMQYVFMYIYICTYILVICTSTPCVHLGGGEKFGMWTHTHTRTFLQHTHQEC